MSSALAAHIRRFAPLSEVEASALIEYTGTIHANKKDILLKEGQVCRSNYFVEKGCLRLYFLDEKGKQQTSQFALENWWLTDYSSYTRGTPSKFFIQAVENASIICFHKSEEERAFAAIPSLERYFRQVLEKSYGASQWRIRYIFSQSKELRYRHFLESFPGFVQRIPQYMLASYLGITPEYMSELRKNKW